MYTVHWSSEDATFVGLCDAFPSMSWCADSFEEASDGILHLVRDVVADLLASGEPLPLLYLQHAGNEPPCNVTGA
jgi:predicted RNase H-like HicB family nuclease